MNEPVGVLGRLSYSDINKNGLVESNEILSEADYYPFGLQHTENSIATTANKAAEKYQYNAKEFQDELNLNVFDYGARNYDAAIGRWFNHDPLSEMAYDLTPYRYSFNNPINFINPNGMFETKFGAWWHKLWNGSSDAGGIEYNDQRSEYYYNDMVASSSNEINFKTVYNSVEGDAGKPVFEIETKMTIGAQIGVTTPYGNIEAGIITADIGSLGFSNQRPSEPIAKWGDGKGHNFIGGSLNFPFLRRIGVSGKADYVTNDMVPYGQLLDYYPNNGGLQTEWGIGPSRSVKMANMYQFTNKTSLGGGEIGARVGTPIGTSNHVLDISGGIKAILGIEGSLKIGVTGRKRK